MMSSDLSSLAGGQLSQLASKLKTTAGGSHVFNPDELVASLRTPTPELDDEGNPIKPHGVGVWLRGVIADITHSIFSIFDPSDDDLYTNSMTLIVITCAGLVVATGQVYLTLQYAKTNSAQISPDIITGLNTLFMVCAGVTFFNLLIYAYMAKKGQKSFDKATTKFFAIFNFILVIVASGVGSLTRRVLDNIINIPSLLVQYDASAIRLINANFSRAARTINWMILWNGLQLIYFVGGEFVRYYLAE